MPTLYAYFLSTIDDGGLFLSQQLTSDLVLVGLCKTMYVGLSLLCPTASYTKALWPTFMHTADESAIGFCGTEAVNTVSFY